MMEDLNIIFKKTQNPYLTEQKGSQYDLWGELTLRYGDINLLKCEWEMNNWIQSFIERKKALLQQRFPFSYTDSIAISYEKLNDEIAEIEDVSLADKQDDVLNGYFPEHMFHIDGTTTPMYFIGKNPVGNGEISYYVEAEDKYYKYEFDMPAFVEQADKSIINYLKKFQLKLTSDEEYFKRFLGEEYAQYIGENARLDAMSFGF
ncbi:hypothetical protein [Lactovum odontotermitis]